MGEIRENPELRDQIRVFENRREAGERLGEKLEEYKKTKSWILAIPAGGVPVGIEVSKKLDCLFDIIIVRKMHIPWNLEAGFGSITSSGETLFNYSLLEKIDISEEQIKQQVRHEKQEIEKRMEKFRNGQPLPDLENETVIIVDDGMASGFSMLAAIRSVKKQKPEKLLVAIPTATKNSIEKISEEVEEIICLNIHTGQRFAVAEAYETWHDLTDQEITRLLKNFDKYQRSI